MASKNISITTEIYSKLKKVKRPNESFSGVIARLLKKRKSPFEFLGIWEKWGDFAMFEKGITKARKEDRKKIKQIVDAWND